MLPPLWPGELGTPQVAELELELKPLFLFLWSQLPSPPLDSPPKPETLLLEGSSAVLPALPLLPSSSCTCSSGGGSAAAASCSSATETAALEAGASRLVDRPVRAAEGV